MKRHRLSQRLCLILLVAGHITVFGCNRQPYYAPLKETKSKNITDPVSVDRAPSPLRLSTEKIRLDTDLKRMKAFSRALAEMAEEMEDMRKRSHVWEKDYFPPEEHDEIENIIFRYLLFRQSLWEMIDYYMNYRDHFSSVALQTRGFLIGLSAGLHLTTYSSLVVATFLNEPMGKSKINEPYHRSGIPEGTYDLLYAQVTSIDNIEAIKAAWFLFTNEWEDPDSVLNDIYHSDLQYRDTIDRIQSLYGQTDRQIQFVLEEDSLLLPKTTNRLRQTTIVRLANQAKEALDDNLYGIRGLVFVNISRIKMPLSQPISFSPGQKNQIISLLEPGDIILTYTAGYMSNIFLPGKFKHGIIFAGTPAQRRTLGVEEDPLSHIPEANRKALLENLSKETLDSGFPADVIEAVAEGVIHNSLDYLLDTHISRMVVFRPRLTPEEKKDVLITAFALLGSAYDFKFDFNDGAYQCCTEVIYRSLNAKGRFDFSLVKRMGSFTLSADDIVGYQLALDTKPFDFVLYAEEDPSRSGHHARVLTSEEGEERFRALMAL